MRLRVIMLVNEPYLIMMFINKIKLENIYSEEKILLNLLEQELVAMMLNNLIEVTFYMESNDYINMKEIDKILNIKNAEFYSKGDLFTSPNQKIQFVIEQSYYSFGIDKEENLKEKINKIIKAIENIKKDLNYIFKKYKLNKELIIYSWGTDEATREYKISLNQIQLLSELGIELKIIHYNF